MPPMYTECIGFEDGTLIPNPNSCLSFFECIDELPYPRFCDDGLWFDMDDLACGEPDSVNCIVNAPSTTPITTVITTTTGITGK